MSNSQPNPHLEELAALQALGLLDEKEKRELFEVMQRHAEINGMTKDFAETASLLAYQAPQIEPPPDLRSEIMRQLPARGSASKIIPFSHWVPYAIAACLMVLGITQARQILDQKNQLLAARTNEARLSESNALIGLRLATLEAKDASYAASKILVAWDPYQHRGVVSMENLPTPPAGHDYQLWVLDPGAEAPVSAGLITQSRPFSVQPVSTPAPGFAISLEPSGGRPEPTGPILFAVAPGS
jgi:anti-sigma-K factor RskA